jgi:succinate-semialdehyde dehydrogenase/glutarate-semialdehyde dehydrogenase
MMARLISKNPARNYEALGEVEISTLEEVQEKVKAAHQAKDGWRKIGLEKRIEYLKQVIESFERDKKQLAELISKEMGKPVKEAMGEMELGIDYFRSYLDKAPSYLKPLLTHEDAKERHEVIREPYGVAAVIVAWNFPFSNFVWQCGENLTAGNTVVFKHSEETPLFGKAIEEVMVKHLPPGVFSEVYGYGDVGEMLINQDVDLICFTGSSKTGIKINTNAAVRFIKTVMELGGSAPGIIFEDANIDAVLESLYQKRFMNCGQMCDALKRLIVHESKLDEIVTKLKEKLKKVKIGDPLEGNTQLGPLVAERQLVLLKEQMADAIEKGASVLLGGKEPENLKGAYYEPTLLTHITQNMRVWTEEVFGPLLPIITFKDEKEAVTLANDTKYGLGAYIFTADTQRFLKLASEIKSGMISQNSLSYVKVFDPFGGYKLSGNGREHAQFGMSEVTQIKVVAREK